MSDLVISDNVFTSLSASNGNNLVSHSTGLTQQRSDLAISDGVLSTEDSNEILADMFPITNSRFLNGATPLCIKKGLATPLCLY